MTDWEHTTIGALIERWGGSIKTGPFGTALKASEYALTGVPLISVGEIGYGNFRVGEHTPRVDESVTNRLPEYVLQAGDIVFGRKGAVDRSAIVTPDEEGWFLGSDGIRLRLAGGCEPRFVFYWLSRKASRDWLLQQSTGSTMASLNQSIIGRLPLILPPLHVQHAVSEALTTLDDKIELNRRMNETLEAMAQAIFRDWFVDFGPVRRKMEGATDPVAIMGGLNTDPTCAEGLAALFPAVLSDVGLPMDWVRSSFDEIVTITKGRSYKSAELQPSKTALVTLKSFARGGGYRPDGLKPYTGTFKVDQVVEAGDIVVSQTDVTQAADIIGRPAIVSANSDFEALVASLDVSIVRAKKPQIFSREFLYQTMRDRRFTEHALAHVTGTTVLHLAKNALPSFTSIVPSTDLILAFDKLALPMRQRILAADRESETLAETRDYLLPRLMSGQVSVRGIA